MGILLFTSSTEVLLSGGLDLQIFIPQAQYFKMAVKVYGMDASAPVRMVLMTCEVLGIEYEFVVVNLMEGEHLKPDYLKINPQHNIPALVDGDFNLNESRAIAAYLANAYAKDDSIYPKEPKVRARVDQLMYFDMGQLYKSFGDCFYPIAFHNQETIEKAKYEKLEEVLGWAKDFIATTGYVAGTEKLTLADLCFLATLTSVSATGIVDFEKDHPELKNYCDKISAAVPNYTKANGDGIVKFAGFAGDKVKTAVEKMKA